MGVKLTVSGADKFKDDEYVQLQNEFEQIQQCIGMYISYTGKKAALHLFKEIFNNALDECVNKNSPANRVEVYFDEDTQEIIISDNGRGIPFDLMKTVCTKKHTSTKFGRKFNVESAGENGVGLKVTAALSTYFMMVSYRGNESKTLEFVEGSLKEYPIKKEKKTRFGTMLKFTPSEKYLGKCDLDADDICDWLQSMSYICPVGIDMKLVAQKKKSDTIISREYTHVGLSADVLNMADSLEFTPINLSGVAKLNPEDEEMTMMLDASFGYDKSIDEETIDSYCNYVHTVENGTHVDACDAAICAFFTREAKRMDANAKYEVLYEDCKKGLILAVNCRATEPQFSGQTKEKVTNQKIRSEGRKIIIGALEKYFLENQALLKKIIEYLRKIARIRIEAHSIKGIDVKKPTNWMEETDIPGYFRIEDPNYKGYKELIITEGVSAGGAVLNVRNPKYQAVFRLLGVVENTLGIPLQKAMKNQTMRGLVKVLGCGIGSDFDINNLRWNKIIIMTD